jgi:NTP pyrophosphatase (non-canonical NTP hydrolase)
MMKMDFYSYQEISRRTLHMSDNQALTVSNLAMGLAGESGEVIDYLKKVYFHDHPLNKEKVIDELGDVLWYISSLAFVHDIDLDEIAEYNIQKLEKRYPSGFSVEKSINRGKHT